MSNNLTLDPAIRDAYNKRLIILKNGQSGRKVKKDQQLFTFRPFIFEGIKLKGY